MIVHASTNMHKTVKHSSLAKTAMGAHFAQQIHLGMLGCRSGKSSKCSAFIVMHFGLLLCITGYILQLQYVIGMHVSLDQLSYHACHHTIRTLALKQIAKTFCCCAHCWALNVMCLCRQPGLLSVGCTPIQPSLIQLRQAQQAQGAHPRHPQAQIPQCLQRVILSIVVSYQFEIFLMLICATHARWPCHLCNLGTGLRCCLDKLVAMHSSRVTYRCSQSLWEMGCLRGLSGRAETQLQQLSQQQQRSLLAMPCIDTPFSH